jgi:flagellar biogenesis protein FliO
LSLRKPRRRLGAAAFALALIIAPAALWTAQAQAANHSLAQGEQKIPYKPQSGPGTATLIAQTLLVLAGVIALGFAGVYAMKRYLPFIAGYTEKGQRRVQVIETRRLTPRATLFLVELDDMIFLLGQSGDRIVNLYQAPAGPKSPDHAKD